MASVIVVDVVGARPLGQASGILGRRRTISLWVASVLSAFEVMEINVMP